MSAPGTSTWPYNSLTTPPTNLKEAIDWVLRVTGRDGKELNKDNGECICGLAAAVTDLLQSVQLEYNGYQGESNGAEKNNGPPKGRVTECLNGLFSLVQGLGGTAVVRTYIDQLAQVLSALVGWSRIDKCPDKGTCQKGVNGYQHGTKDGCKYLKDVEENKPCTDCGCMKWNVSRPDDEGTPLGRKCTRCSDSGDSDSGCKCGTSGGGSACSPDKCQCALAGKCCKCCCTGCTKCKKECICYKENASLGIYEHKESYVSAYKVKLVHDGYFGREYQVWPKWSDRNTSKKRALGARILLGSVCLIWSGITYMYWTGKYHSSSPRWNNHILDGSGLDDGTLYQWLQALGFPRGMINNSGPRNRWDAVIWDGIRGMLYLGFPETGNGGTAHGGDYDANTFRQPAGMNYAGYIHTVDRGAFCSNATVFKNGDDSSTTDTNTHKCGALYKLYILSCAYFTGLQKKTTESTTSTTTNTPKTIREILYWLSALPYSQAYKQILEHSKGILERVAPDVGDKKQLSFYQTGRSAPITVHEYNLFAHFQAVTQYCPLVLIGIQGGLKGTNSTGPAIHSLYSNSHFSFTYPTVSIQAYNQVVHYIRALFYQLYFLRKQCAVKVAQGGKWRECRYGDGVLGKDVVSWMCLGCDPMEHDRKKRVGELEKILNGVPKGKSGDLPGALKDVLEKIGEVVVQLGNAQEALEGKKTEAIEGVKKKLEGAKTELGKAKGELETAVNGKDGLNGKLAEAKKKLVALTKGGGSGILKELEGALGAANSNDFDQGKNKISEAINGVRDALEALEKGVKDLIKKEVDNDKFALGVIFDPAVVTNEVENVIQQGVSQEYTTLLNAINNLLSICNSPKCSACDKHSTKCGQKAESTICEKCLQPTTTGVPSPPPGIPRGQVTRF